MEWAITAIVFVLSAVATLVIRKRITAKYDAARRALEDYVTPPFRTEDRQITVRYVLGPDNPMEKALEEYLTNPNMDWGTAAKRETLDEHMRNRKCESFAPVPHYHQDGDLIALFFAGEPAYEDQIDATTSLYRSIETDAIVGVQIRGVTAIIQAAVREDQAPCTHSSSP